jgi:hypothetical protein
LAPVSHLRPDTVEARLAFTHHPSIAAQCMIFNHEIKSAEEEMSYSLCSKTGFSARQDSHRSGVRSRANGCARVCGWVA